MQYTKQHLTKEQIQKINALSCVSLACLLVLKLQTHKNLDKNTQENTANLNKQHNTANLNVVVRHGRRDDKIAPKNKLKKCLDRSFFETQVLYRHRSTDWNQWEVSLLFTEYPTITSFKS